MIDHICRNVVLPASAVLYKELYGLDHCTCMSIIVHACQSLFTTTSAVRIKTATLARWRAEYTRCAGNWGKQV